MNQVIVTGQIGSKKLKDARLEQAFVEAIEDADLFFGGKYRCVGDTIYLQSGFMLYSAEKEYPSGRALVEATKTALSKRGLKPAIKAVDTM